MEKNGLSMDNMNTKYKDIIVLFVSNTVLKHVGTSWIIETNKHLVCDMEKHNPDWVTIGPWYNTFISKNYMEKNLLIIQEQTYIISCVLLMHIKNNLSEHDDGSIGDGYTIPLNSLMIYFQVKI